MGDTEKGVWGASVAQDVYDFFVKVKLQNFKRFIDLGSGDGKVVLIASLFTKSSGVEFDKDLHDTAVKIRDELGLKANLMEGDFFDLDLSKYDFIFINPDKGFDKGLEKKLDKEMDDNSRLVVYNNIFLPRFLSRGKTFHFSVPIIGFRK